MIDQSVAHSGTPSTRELRALALYREHRHEITLVGPDTFEVPSQDGERTYRVTYGGEIENCSCPDHQYRDALCVHILAVAICRARRRGGDHDHVRILEDAAAHPERTYTEHVRAAEEIAAAEYREEIRRMMRAGIA